MTRLPSDRPTHRVGCRLPAAVLALALLSTVTAARAARPGVVVEEVGRGSALEAAGLAAGDVLLAWERGEAARGEIASVFDWRWLVVEEAPRGTVVLTGERRGERRLFEVAPGLWKGSVRPRLPATLGTDYQRGRKLIAAGELDQAARIWEGVTTAAAATVGDRQWRGGLAFAMGDVWWQAGAWERTRAAYDAALAAAADPSVRAIVLNRLGHLAWRRGELEPAERSHEQALALRHDLVPGNLAEAESLNNLGLVAKSRGDLDRATELYERSLAIRQRLAPGGLDVATCLNNLGVVAFERGDLDRAAEFYRPSLAIRDELAPDSRLLAITQLNLGGVAWARGDLDRATELGARALTVFERLDPDSLEVAACLHNLAIFADERGDLARAEELYQKALRIKERQAPGSLDVAYSLNNLGIVAKLRGELDRAAELYAQALAIEERLAPDSLDLAVSLHSLGNLALSRGDLVRAQTLHGRALAIRERLAPKGLDVATSLDSLGLLAFDRGDLDRARTLQERALAIREDLAPGSLALATTLANLGEEALRRGDAERALAFYQRSLAIWERLAPGSWAHAEVLERLAVAHRQAGDGETALDYYLRSLAALEAQIGRLGGTETVRAGFRAERGLAYRGAIELLLAQDRPEEAFTVLERSRARSFLTLLAERDLAFGTDVPEELDRTRRRLAILRDRALHRLAASSPAREPEQVEALQQELGKLQREYDDNAERIRRASPRLAALQYPDPLDFRDARNSLDPGTVLLSYNVGEGGTDLFVVRRGQPLAVHAVDLGAAELERRVTALRKMIPEALPGTALGDLRRPAFESAARDLYRALIEPAAQELVAAERLLVVPDGPLHLLPFGALIRDTGARPGSGWEYLVAWRPLHLALSATVYAELGKSRRPAASGETNAGDGVLLAAFGDPRYPESFARGQAGAAVDARLRSAVERGLFNWQPLPHSRREVEQIAALYPPAATRTYTGAGATEERAKAEAGEARVVHFAAHAHLDDRSPLDSGLALTIPEELSPGRDNGLLQVWEIFEGLRLDADLVVLSACQTAAGRAQGGEGLIGLTRAFQYAGARAVAASLWNVDDRATAELMVRFHRHLRAGKPRDEALRAAQLELIRDPAAAFAPFHWAAFQLYGDWR